MKFPLSMCRAGAQWLPLVMGVLLAACAAPPPSAKINLSGFPLEFRQGYDDGCASVRGRRVRNEARFKGDIQYAAGWRDGYDICKR